MRYKDYEGSVNDLILLKLKEMEAAHHVKILHAIESGSRAGALLRRTATTMCA